MISMRHLMLTMPMLGVLAFNAHGDTVAIMDLTASTGFAETYSIEGTDVGNDQQLFSQQIIDDSFSVNANFIGSPDQAFLGGGFQIANSTAGQIDFSLEFLLPVTQMDMALNDWAGSLTIALTGFDASIQSLLNEPIWAAAANGELMGTLFADPFEMSVEGFGTESIAAEIDGSTPFAGGGMLAVRYAFSLSAGDSVVFGGALGYVPAPGAIALLGLASMMGPRRRRSCPNRTT